MKIDFSETFPHLSKAPIVEAVIDFRALPTVPCDQAQFGDYFKAEFKDFPHAQIHNQVNYQLKAKPDGQPEPVETTSNWHGLVFHSADKRKVVQCQRDGFVFSRVQSYDDWNAFTNEALSLWGKYAALTKPIEIQRVGVRFINRIATRPDWKNVEDYLLNAPQAMGAGSLPLVGFLHNNTYFVPEKNYLINLNLALQPADGVNPVPAIIVDTDVFTTNPTGLADADEDLEAKLTEMRWLKNKVFFGSLTEQLIKSLI